MPSWNTIISLLLTRNPEALLTRNTESEAEKLENLLSRPDLTVDKICEAVEAQGLWESLRNLNYVRVDAYFASNGAAHFISMGEAKGPQTTLYHGDTLLAALRRASDARRE